MRLCEIMARSGGKFGKFSAYFGLVHVFAYYSRVCFLLDFLVGGKKKGWPFELALALAIVAETSWELFENSDFIINRYREVTISLDYYGDSVINSVSDALFMVLGFMLAHRLPAWVVIALIIIMELEVGYVIRDNLTLNIIMLIYPFEAIKHWQTGG